MNNYWTKGNSPKIDQIIKPNKIKQVRWDIVLSVSNKTNRRWIIIYINCNINIRPLDIQRLTKDV